MRVILVLMAAMAALVAACGTPPATQSPTAPSTGPPPTAHRPVGNEPYRFGQSQALAPSIADGRAPIIRHIPTDKRYVFITIDDGEIRLPEALELIKNSGLRPTLFLAQRYVTGHEDYFRAIRDQTGAAIEDHTVHHPNLRGKPYALQHKEICDSADAETADFGRRPTLFRPPYGNYDAITQQAAAACGMKAVVLWTAAVNDGVVQFQQGDHLNPGDIVLMHFRTTFVEDYTAFLNRAKLDNLTPVPLPDFLS